VPKETPLINRISTAACVSIGALLLTVATLLSVSGAFGQGIPVAPRLGLLLAGFVLYVAGAGLYKRGKRASTELAGELLSSDPRPAVVYLRSFKDDVVGASIADSPVATLFSLVATEEQQIAEVFGELGPVVAIGRPGERLPELGAARMYVADDEWQETVSDLMARARLVVYRATDTQGFIWEVKRGGELLPPEKIVFLIPAKSNYDAFRRIADKLLPGRFPAKPESRLRCGSLSGLVYFDSTWRSRFVLPRITWGRNEIRKPVVSVLKMMVEPVFLQLGYEWSPPPIRWGCYIPYLVVTLIVPMGLILWLTILGKFAGLQAFLILVGGFHCFMLLIVALVYLFSPR